MCPFQRPIITLGFLLHAALLCIFTHLLGFVALKVFFFFFQAKLAAGIV